MDAGIALDVGTTNIDASLVELKTKKVLASASTKNSQSQCGKDIMTRLTYTLEKKEAVDLKILLNFDLEKIFSELLAKGKISKEEVKKVYVVGNTLMLHFFLGADPTGLATFPYTPEIKKSVVKKASLLGFRLGKETQVVTFPIISGFVGADAVGVILSTSMDQKKSITLTIDLGTNAEIILGSQKKLLVCSAAAGPAFASSCLPLGTEVISTVASALRHGAIDGKGALAMNLKNESCPQITQADVRAFRVAKAAVRAGIHVLLKDAGLKVSDITEIILTGSFGQRVESNNAIETGLLPEFPLGKIHFVDNAALEGAKMALLSEEAFKRTKEIPQKVKHVELSTHLEFEEKFIDYMNFA